jgi:hypothetical protein
MRAFARVQRRLGVILPTVLLLTIAATAVASDRTVLGELFEQSG